MKENYGVNRSLVLAAAIINWVAMGAFIISTAFVGIFVVAWFIPMTITMHKIASGKRTNSVGLGVCTLIFCNLLSGIFLLCAGGFPKED